MQTIQVIGSPKPVGHYSQAVVSNGLIYTSGILPIKIQNSEKLSPDSSIEEQLNVVLENLNLILQAAGSNKNKVIKTTIFISNGDDWGIVNQVYSEFFGEHRPARSIVPVKDLHYGFKIELEAIAELS
jgi:2-iminobutanoate/2-iminopropanoate deaminase